MRSRSRALEGLNLNHPIEPLRDMPGVPWCLAGRLRGGVSVALLDAAQGAINPGAGYVSRATRPYELGPPYQGDRKGNNYDITSPKWVNVGMPRTAWRQSNGLRNDREAARCCHMVVEHAAKLLIAPVGQDTLWHAPE
jgi:hypothetical protein